MASEVAVAAVESTAPQAAPVHGTSGGIAEVLAKLSHHISSGDPNVDMTLGMIALGIAVITVIIIFVARRRAPVQVDDALFERIEQLQLVANELKNAIARPQAELKGAAGYLKQELGEIRTHIGTLAHQISVIEQAIQGLKSREQRGKYIYDAPQSAAQPQAGYGSASSRLTETFTPSQRMRQQF